MVHGDCPVVFGVDLAIRHIEGVLEGVNERFLVGREETAAERGERPEGDRLTGRGRVDGFRGCKEAASAAIPGVNE
jgi:hypothetical protein